MLLSFECFVGYGNVSDSARNCVVVNDRIWSLCEEPFPARMGHILPRCQANR